MTRDIPHEIEKDTTFCNSCLFEDLYLVVKFKIIL